MPPRLRPRSKSFGESTRAPALLPTLLGKKRPPSPSVSPAKQTDASPATRARKRRAPPSHSATETPRPRSPAQTDFTLDTKRKRGRPPKSRDGTPTTPARALKLPLNILPRPAWHVRPSRHLFIFGNGEMGQFGLGITELGSIPAPTLHSWFEGAIQSGILGDEGAGLEKVVAGGMHTLAIDEEGRVWSWGINDNASLGRPTIDVPDPINPQHAIDPEILETQPMVIDSLIEEEFRAVAVAAGASVSVALGLRGELRVWGSFRSSDGLLGFDGKPGSSKTQFVPLSLPALEGNKFVSVACGTDHIIALTTTGHVYAWGNGQQAQLGRRIIERRKVNGLAPERLALRNIVAVGSGSYHSFAVDKKGVVYAWGLNSCRQTGVRESRGGAEAIVANPTIVDALHPDNLGKGRVVTAISGGEHHSLFLLNDGSVWGCGRSDGFELGLNDDHPAMKKIIDARDPNVDAAKRPDEYVPEPVPIPFPPAPPTDTNVDMDTDDPPLPPYDSSVGSTSPSNPMAQISAGMRHNLAVSRSGQVYGWGYAPKCQLGLGEGVDSSHTPRRLKSAVLEGWKVEYAGAGEQHCVLMATKSA
ncbi:hypothetical protein BOTBODRAFT_26088 [Botryobasidium botryosum FD-172 SS1]|uniref:RCC1-like domain-containing protein n=1 Tax=Botryobasidium botryosum (strain FD-172 SS1) TaxID=930990 RepID=A0A067NBZ5_BOTB1|nr:hypothetical protein BOTBODRAFT_26088 [Botryobasidium botryosum FD-172 SS1]